MAIVHKNKMLFQKNDCLYNFKCLQRPLSLISHGAVAQFLTVSQTGGYDCSWDDYLLLILRLLPH